MYQVRLPVRIQTAKLNFIQTCIYTYTYIYISDIYINIYQYQYRCRYQCSVCMVCPVQYFGYTYTKKYVYLHFKFNWVSCILI